MGSRPEPKQRDSHLILEEQLFYIAFLTFRLLLVTIAEDLKSK